MASGNLTVRLAVVEGGGVLVEGAGEAGGLVEVLSHVMAELLGVHEPDAEPAPPGRIGAGPGATDGGESGDDGLAVQNEPAVPVGDADNGQHPGDRAPVEPVRVQRAAGHHLGEAFRVPQRLERGVGGGGGWSRHTCDAKPWRLPGRLAQAITAPGHA